MEETRSMKVMKQEHEYMRWWVEVSRTGKKEGKKSRKVVLPKVVYTSASKNRHGWHGHAVRHQRHQRAKAFPKTSVIIRLLSFGSVALKLQI